MRTKTLAITLLILPLALSACGPATIAASPAAPQRTLSVTGAGQVSLTPDIAYIYIGVHTEKPSATEAVAENSTSTQKVIDALKNFGVDAKDIQTINFSIWPNTQYDSQTGKQTGTTYMVDNTVYVKVRELTKLASLLDTVVRAGANSVNSIQFDVADKTAALKQARAEAVKNAKEQAQELADTAGVTLGEIQTIAFYDSIPSPVMDAYGKGGGGAEASLAIPIQPGQMTLTVTVSVTYAIR